MFTAALNKIYFQGATMLLIRSINPVRQIKLRSEHETRILLDNKLWNYYLDPNNIKEIFFLYPEYDEKEIEEVYNFNKSDFWIFEKNGIQLLKDTRSKFYNVINNSRLTLPLLPDSREPSNSATLCKNIYLFGNCIAAGAFMEDKFTLASQLQQRLFNDSIWIQIKNMANWGDLEVTCRQIISPLYMFKEHDLIILFTHAPVEDLIKTARKSFDDMSFFHFIDISSCYQRPHDYGEIFIDRNHMNHKGSAFTADIVYPYVKEIIQDMGGKKNFSILPEIAKYIAKYNLNKLEYKKVGAIVMNCNPFTLGHLYLIEQALKEVEFLYVFIVEEDRSIFKFEDRFRLVSDNLHNQTSVKVLPSGSIMISQATLPQYFEKENLKEAKLDYTMDLEIFCRYIAPQLGITHRFAGTEPICPVTNQYNAAMAEVLPRYGIEFIEIPRLNHNHDPISASLVREHIKDKNFYELIKMVPFVTFRFLVQKGYIQPPAYSKINLEKCINEEWYFEQYPDVRASGLNGSFHYVNYGWKEGRNPIQWFNTQYYLDANQDVRLSTINPYLHFLTFGIHENRSPNPYV